MGAGAPTITVERQGGVARVALDRPERRNAISLALRRELATALGDLAADPAVGALILAGNGPVFCAGGDLDELAALDGREAAIERLEAGNRMVQALAAFPVPTVAAVRGAAAGAGAALALACDFLVAGGSAELRLPFVGIGLAPDAGSSWLLPRRLGLPAALRVALLGGRLDAGALAAAGVADAVVADADVDAEADRLAQRLAAQPRAAVVAAKRLLAAGAESTLEAALGAELEVQVDLLGGADFRAALDRRKEAAGAR